MDTISVLIIVLVAALYILKRVNKFYSNRNTTQKACSCPDCGKQGDCQVISSNDNIR